MKLITGQKLLGNFYKLHAHIGAFTSVQSFYATYHFLSMKH